MAFQYTRRSSFRRILGAHDKVSKTRHSLCPLSTCRHSTGDEFLLNARPLTPISSDPADADALTPNHFLHGRPHLQLHSNFESQPQGLSNRRWMDAQEILNHFWKRWMREYIPRLIERKKWKRPQRNLAFGDGVLMVMPSSKRNTWPLGRIVRVETGVDGIVRSAEVEVTRAHPGKRNRKEPHDVKTAVKSR